MMTSATTTPSQGARGRNAERHGYGVGVVLFAAILRAITGCVNLLVTFAIGSSHDRRRRPCTRSANPRGPSTRRFRAATATAVAGASLLVVAGTQVLGAGVAGAATTAASPTGFPEPYLGVPGLAGLAPTEATNTSQINQPIGQAAADRLAKELGFLKANSLTATQYDELISGGGVGGNAADGQLLEENLEIYTNTIGRPLYTGPYVLGSYGLFVNSSGQLMSLANKGSPTRQVNALIVPGGFLYTWLRANGATRALVNLFTSAFPLEGPFGALSQLVSGMAELVPNTLGGVSTQVGMGLAPCIWLINFIFVYMANPTLAADMPAYWAPVPAPVAAAIQASPTGQVPYSEYESYFQ